MTDDRAAKRLRDARRAAERIARFTSGRTRDDYLGDEMLRSAVERQFEIIGEAFTGLRRVDPSLAATIPDLPRVVAFRNVSFVERVIAARATSCLTQMPSLQALP